MSLIRCVFVTNHNDVSFDSFHALPSLDGECLFPNVHGLKTEAEMSTAVFVVRPVSSGLQQHAVRQQQTLRAVSDL